MSWIATLVDPGFWRPLKPKLATTLTEGYGWSRLRADAIAGLTVAIVALPLAMAIAIGSGVTPDRGLTTAVVGGFLISALGGSRFQIGVRRRRLSSLSWASPMFTVMQDC